MQQEETGLLIPQNDIPALRGAMLRLLDDAELRKRLEINAHQEARENGIWEKRVEDLEKLLNAIQ